MIKKNKNDYHDTIVIAGRNYNSLADKIKFKITSYDQDKEKQQSKTINKTSFDKLNYIHKGEIHGNKKYFY